MEQSKRPADFSRNPGAAAEGGGVCRSGGHRNHVSAGKSDIAMGTSTQQLKQLTGCLAEWWWSLWNPQNCKAGVDVKIQGSERCKEKPGEYIRGEQGPPPWGWHCRRQAVGLCDDHHHGGDEHLQEHLRVHIKGMNVLLFSPPFNLCNSTNLAWSLVPQSHLKAAKRSLN